MTARRQDDLAADIKYLHRTVYHQRTSGSDCFGKSSDTKVCRKIGKTDFDTQDIPADSCAYNIGTGAFPGKPLDMGTLNVAFRLRPAASECNPIIPKKRLKFDQNPLSRYNVS